MTGVMPEVSIIFLDFVTTLRKLRAATLLTTHGYLGVGYGLLRDVKDKTIHLSAVFQRMITSLDLMGISPTHPPKATNEELKNLHRRNRIRTERKVIGDFIGASSGFSEDDIFELGALGRFIRPGGTWFVSIILDLCPRLGSGSGNAALPAR